jgi:tetratricopeptide (TPR) repeat protein
MSNRWLAPLLIVAIAVLAYSNTFQVPFLFDDIQSIRDNARIRSLLPLTSSMSWQPQTAVAGRPVVCLSLAVNYAISGLEPWSYHVFNLLVHVLNALLLWGILRRVFERSALGARRAAPLAFAAALLWVAHPLQTEAVTYIVQRTELLFAFFLLLTIDCVIRAADSPGRGVWRLMAVIACALGMGSKEVMAAAPLLGLLFDRIFLAQQWREVLRRRGILHAALMATWIIAAALAGTSPRSATAGFGVEISPWHYLLTQAGVIVHYLRLAVFPYPLSLDYSDWAIAKNIGDVALPAAVIVTLLGLTAWALWKKPALGFAGVWFFLILAPSSSFVPIATEVVAERRMYLPLAAVVVCAVLLFDFVIGQLLRDSPQQTWVKLGSTAVIVSTWAVATFARNRDYRDELTLWLDVAEKRPLNATARHNIGVILNQRGQTETAQRYFAEAMRLRPDLKAAYLNTQGIELARAGKLTEAIARYEEALRIVPDLASARSNWAQALFRLGRVDEAMAQYEMALKLAPYDAATQYHLGVALLSAGKTDDAIRHLREAIKIKPDAELAHGALGRAWVLSGNLGDGVKHLREALRLNPDLHPALNDLARVLATAGNAKWRNGAEALRLAERANALTNFSNAEYMDALAAAHAENGDFERAIQTAEQAAQLAEQSGQGRLLEKIRAHLQSYRAGKPWREQTQ